MSSLCNVVNIAHILKFEGVASEDIIRMLVESRGKNREYVGKVIREVEDKTEEDINKAVEDMLDDSEGRDMETIKNDTLTPKEKIKVAVAELGAAKKEDVIDWINSNTLLLKVSERHIRRLMKEMVEDETLVEVDDVVFLATAPESRWVVLGERKVGAMVGELLCLCGKYHRGIKIVESGENPISGSGKWWEVSPKKENNSTLVFNLGEESLPVGDPFVGVSSNTGTTPKQFLGTTTKSDSQIYIYVRKYQKTWPDYHGLWNNCLDFADYLQKFLVPKEIEIKEI